ncbi:MAG: hypothetical protein EOM20_17860 [Spartobacteria bacterium]|nr:hypothetical protein [Spartobacteria bacterium]
MSESRHPSCGHAPGKVILTGEHAVVYGNPALVMSVDLYARCVISDGIENGLTVSFPGQIEERWYPAARWIHRVAEINARYEAFLDGTCRIQEVLDDPFDIIMMTAALALEKVGHPFVPLRCHMESDIPIGCGMGSSASVIVSVLRAIFARYDIAPPVDQLFEWAFQMESLQHGRPSGVDPYVVIHEGIIRFRKGMESRTLHVPPFPWTLIHTGAPESATGECVEHVANLRVDNAVWNEFRQVASRVEHALQHADVDALKDGVRANHRLLVNLGLVPDTVQEFIRRMEWLGSAAKICGAGAVRGEHAGVVWVVADEVPEDICREFGFERINTHEEEERTP